MFKNSALINETDRLRNFARRLTNNIHDAEDLLHNTIVRALEKKHLFKTGTNLYSWASKVMYNIFVSQYRRKTKFESQYDPEPYINAQSVEARQDKKMEFQDVENAMNDLSEDHRDILFMVCVEGMRYADVSEKLQIPVGTVRSRLSRARESLEDKLENTNKPWSIPQAPQQTQLHAHAA